MSTDYEKHVMEITEFVWNEWIVTSGEVSDSLNSNDLKVAMYDYNDK